MMPELGQVALILALLLACVQAAFPLLGAWRGSPALIRMARPAATGQFVFVALAYAVLTHAFLVNDFSVAYVAQNSNLTLPWYYRLSAVWGAHSGSLLLWVMILNLWTLAVAIFSRRLPEAFAARVLGVMGLVSVGFLAFMVFTSNPFLRLLPAPANGMDLNPVLQDPGLVIHPPMLYMGYVGFRWPSHSPSRHCSVARSTMCGCAGRGHGPTPRSDFSRPASCWAAGGPTPSWAGVAGGSGILSRMPRSCRGWSARR